MQSYFFVRSEFKITEYGKPMQLQNEFPTASSYLLKFENQTRQCTDESRPGFTK